MHSSSPQASKDSTGTGGDSVTVRINGMRFEPATITVTPGTTVTWLQQSPMPHTVSGTSGALKSSALRSGQRYSHTFDAPGSYDYVCDFHPGMKGRVVVDDSGDKS
jgi:amicyanin